MTIATRKVIISLALGPILASLLGGFTPADAQNRGDFVNYSFSYSGMRDSEMRSASGTFRQEILNDFSNGTLRVRYSGKADGAVFALEKNVAERRFSFPHLPELSVGTTTFQVQNSTVTMTINGLPDEIIEFQGSTARLNVSEIKVSYERTTATGANGGTATGIVKVFKSGLLYSFDGALRGASSGDLQVILVSTNLDPEASMRSEQLSILLAEVMGVGGVMDGNMGGPSAGTQAGTRPYVLVISLLAIVAVIGGITFGRRKRSGPPAQSQRPLHWVD